MTVEERLEKYLGKDPQIDPTAYVSKNAVLMGDIKIGKNRTHVDCRSANTGCADAESHRRRTRRF